MSRPENFDVLRILVGCLMKCIVASDFTFMIMTALLSLVLYIIYLIPYPSRGNSQNINEAMENII